MWRIQFSYDNISPCTHLGLLSPRVAVHVVIIKGRRKTFHAVWSHTKAACSNFLSATWTKCSLNLRSCPIDIFACQRHHLPQQECMAMPIQLVHLRFLVTDTRGKIHSVLLTQDRQRWPGARYTGQNFSSPAYEVSTGFLQPASPLLPRNTCLISHLFLDLTPRETRKHVSAEGLWCYRP